MEVDVKASIVDLCYRMKDVLQAIDHGEPVTILIPVNEQITFAAAILLEDHCLSDGVSIIDALIAATARDTADTLATANLHFRRIPSLSLYPFRPRR